MKNLSCLISVFVITVLFSCSNNKNNIKTKTQSVVEKPLIDNAVSNVDSTKNQQIDIVTDRAKTKIDTLNKNTKQLNKVKKKGQEAPKHNSPDQSKIDSLKKAKQKFKN
ncbi:MAG: hypothetical protein ABF260_10440 [Flavobacteriaceae bacterium]